jgi:CDP-4-dehydro-6-deoxyglucose reductase, E1
MVSKELLRMEMTDPNKLRDEILKKTKLYYELVHKDSGVFRPGIDKIHYAGRVFDENEMVNLVDSALEFWLTAGRYAQEFETKLAKKLGLNYALLVNSGSSANLVAFSTLTSHMLKEKRIKKGDEVITVAAGFPTTVSPVVQFGAVPVFVDVDLETANIDVRYLEEALSPKTRAIMIAHTLGNPFDLGTIVDFCKKHDLWLIEDNCDALGSTYDGKHTGTFGDIATSSFYPPHHLTMGEGGAVYMNHPLLKRIAASFRDWGRDCWCDPGKDNTCGRRFSQQHGTLPYGYDHKYIYSHFGYNLKVSDMQASVGVAQLDKLELFAQKRRANWQKLSEGVRDLEEFFILPKATPKSNPSWFGFLLSIRDDAPFNRDELIGFLEADNIQTRNLFAGNMIRQPAYQTYLKEGKDYRVVGELKNTDKIMTDSFWLGVFPGMKEGQVEYMIESLQRFVHMIKSK